MQDAPRRQHSCSHAKLVRAAPPAPQRAPRAQPRRDGRRPSPPRCRGPRPGGSGHIATAPSEARSLALRCLMGGAQPTPPACNPDALCLCASVFAMMEYQHIVGRSSKGPSKQSTTWGLPAARPWAFTCLRFRCVCESPPSASAALSGEPSRPRSARRQRLRFRGPSARAPNAGRRRPRCRGQVLGREAETDVGGRRPRAAHRSSLALRRDHQLPSCARRDPRTARLRGPVSQRQGTKV